ncbi:hypothetical protein BDB00DRAFT_880044 [Zychaea mexicana]|uniref:uncharacterized protein n=1 Tax=Zychaea mexicana TaxID=64656 RepID=UPI0022FE6105|nr:uncharacterized protein BDB00DRAFT_880044 [Zychaea mexicana]KAI9471389.1 hypothetical protein BDB00DRAFT_880044 [Zychaea mexicana]
MDSFTSKVAVITGGSRGIGYNVAAALVDRGAKVVLGDILDQQGEDAARELNERVGKQVVAYLHTDVTKYKDLKALFALAEKLFGGVDIAVLNAGITGKGSGGIFTPLDGDKVALLHMAKSGKGGVIVNTASLSGVLPASPIAAYSASKFAVVGWTRSLAHMKHVANVRVNAVCPAVCDTDINSNLDDQSTSDYLEFSPKVQMEVIVQAFLRCIEDPRLSGDILMALPDGVHVQPKYIAPASSVSKEYLEKFPEIRKRGTKFAKDSLAQAIENAKL